MQHVSSGGAEIPALGFGTFRMKESEVEEVLPAALRHGFRHVDTAQIYGNEAAVGAAIGNSGVPRSEIFLTTKVWVTSFEPKDFLPSVESSLRKLRTDAVDLLLLHWPGGSNVPHETRIGLLNEAKARGMTRHIGISNYSSAQMATSSLLSEAPLVTNQVEHHPFFFASSSTQGMRRARHVNDGLLRNGGGSGRPEPVAQ